MEDVRNYNRIEKRINVLLNEVEMLCKQYEETNNDSFRKLLKEEMKNRISTLKRYYTAKDNVQIVLYSTGYRNAEKMIVDLLDDTHLEHTL